MPRVAAVSMVLLAALSGLGVAGRPAAAQPARVLRIATQPGIGYGQLIVMQAQRLLEKQVPGLRVEWQQLTSGPVIRDAMLAGQVVSCCHSTRSPGTCFSSSRWACMTISWP